MDAGARRGAGTIVAAALGVVLAGTAAVLPAQLRSPDGPATAAARRDAPERPGGDGADPHRAAPERGPVLAAVTDTAAGAPTADGVRQGLGATVRGPALGTRNCAVADAATRAQGPGARAGVRAPPPAPPHARTARRARS
ncbi:hypothetical protein ACFV0G_26845, partial [Kitasatospora sp. NPDC059571]